MFKPSVRSDPDGTQVVELAFKPDEWQQIIAASSQFATTEPEELVFMAVERGLKNWGIALDV